MRKAHLEALELTRRHMRSGAWTLLLSIKTKSSLIADKRSEFASHYANDDMTTVHING